MLQGLQLQGGCEVGCSAQIAPCFFMQPKFYGVLVSNMRTNLRKPFSFAVELRVSLIAVVDAAGPLR